MGLHLGERHGGCGELTFSVITLKLNANIVCQGGGLLSTLQVDSSSAKWIGYQIIYGAGVGFGLNQPLIAVQTALPNHQIAEGTAVIIFMQTFGGTIFIAVAQNVFNNKLIANVRAQAIPVDPVALLSVGATQLQKLVDPQYFGRLQLAYNESITQVSHRYVPVPPTRACTLHAPIRIDR